MSEIHGEFETPVRDLALRLRNGAVIGLATDTTYALVAALSSKKGVQLIRDLRRVPPSKNLSLLLRDLEHISRYAYIDRGGYRLVKRLAPGKFTFILKATKDLPRLTLTKQRTVGIRVCGVDIVNALCQSLDEPLISASAALGDGEGYAETAEQVAEIYPQLEVVLDGGHRTAEQSTVIDLTGPTPQVLRMGEGHIEGVLVQG